jgi:hypothetical protein
MNLLKNLNSYLNYPFVDFILSQINQKFFQLNQVKLAKYSGRIYLSRI